MKPGIKSTEFWVSLIAIILVNIQSSGLIGASTLTMKIITAVLSIVGALGYTAQRTSLKNAVLGSQPASTNPTPVVGAPQPDSPK